MWASTLAKWHPCFCWFQGRRRHNFCYFCKLYKCKLYTYTRQYVCVCARTIVVLPSLSRVWLFVTPWTAAHQASLSFTIPWNLLKTHIHWVDDAIQPSYTLPPPSSPALDCSQHQGLFQRVGFSHQVNTHVHIYLGFPSGSDSKEFACNVGDKDSIPGSGRPLGEGNGSYFSILAWRIPQTEEPWGSSESDTTDRLTCVHTHTHTGRIYIPKGRGSRQPEARLEQHQWDPRARGNGTGLNSISLMDGPGCLNIFEKEQSTKWSMTESESGLCDPEETV